MKKRFLIDDDAKSLWDEFEENGSIEIVEGASPVTTVNGGDSLSCVTDKDHTITVWRKSF